MSEVNTTEHRTDLQRAMLSYFVGYEIGKRATELMYFNSYPENEAMTTATDESQATETYLGAVTSESGTAYRLGLAEGAHDIESALVDYPIITDWDRATKNAGGQDV